MLLIRDSYRIYKGKMTLVVDGLVVLDNVYEELKTNRPTNLTDKLEIGRDWAGGMWVATTGIVTELNIFKGALSKQEMARMTSIEQCLPPGDYEHLKIFNFFPVIIIIIS